MITSTEQLDSIMQDNYELWKYIELPSEELQLVGEFCVECLLLLQVVGTLFDKGKSYS